MLELMLLRRLLPIAVVVMVFIAFPALAAPPAPEGNIWLDQADARLAGGVSYGDTVTFGWELEAKNRDYYVTIRVVCYQGSDQVYWWAGSPDSAFPLRDQTPDGSWWNGGSATCTASLMASQNHKHILTVAQTHFDVVGAAG